MARKICSDQVDAEDATQEIFIEIWKNADRYDPGLGSESTFISMIARRRLIDRLRKNSRALPTVSMEGEYSGGDSVPKDTLEISDEVGKALKCMEQLKPEERKVIELSICQHVPQTKIAEVLDLPLGTVKTHARRGMIRLRELLGLKPQKGSV